MGAIVGELPGDRSMYYIIGTTEQYVPVMCSPALSGVTGRLKISPKLLKGGRGFDSVLFPW